MDVVGNATNQNGRTIHIFCDPSKKSMNFPADIAIRQEWKTVFRREDERFAKKAIELIKRLD